MSFNSDGALEVCQPSRDEKAKYDDDDSRIAGC